MRRVLLLRPTGGPVAGADLLVTHRVVPAPSAIAETASYDPAGAILVVSSLNAVDILRDAPGGTSSRAPTASSSPPGPGRLGPRGGRVAEVVTPDPPGAVGILAELERRGETGRLLWPRGSDADVAPLSDLASRGFEVTAPIVYVKEPLAALEAGRLAAFRAGSTTLWRSGRSPRSTSSSPRSALRRPGSCRR